MSSEFDLSLAFMTGILGAFHCIGMCIGVNGGSFAGCRQRPQIIDLAVFHGTRIGVYTVLGVSGAMLGRVVVQSGVVGKAQGLLMMLAGILIVLLGLMLTGWIGGGAQTKQGVITVPLLDSSSERRTHRLPLVAGIFNGLVPCSLVSLVAIKGAATADPIQAGLMMLAFGAGTLPTLVTLSLFGSFTGFRFHGKAAQILGMTVVAAGLWTVYQGYVFYDIIRGLANW